MFPHITARRHRIIHMNSHRTIQILDMVTRTTKVEIKVDPKPFTEAIMEIEIKEVGITINDGIWISSPMQGIIETYSMT